MTAPIQKGTALYVGWGSYTHASYVTDDVEIMKGAEIQVIKGADNETLTKIISDPHTKLKLSLLILSGGSLVPPIPGSSFTINSVTYMVEGEPKVQPSRTTAKLTLDLIKEDSMTYS